MKELKIKIENTPNPSTKKFVFQQPISDKIVEFKNSVEARISPLAMKVFGFPWADSIFIGNDFVSVTKQGLGRLGNY